MQELHFSSGHENKPCRLTHPRQWFPRLGGRLPGISSRQERERARPNRSRDRWVIHPRDWPTSLFPSLASLTAPHTCTCRPMGSPSCSKPSSLSFLFLCALKERAFEAFLLRSIPRSVRGFGQKHGHVPIVVAVMPSEICRPGRYPGHRCCRLRRLTGPDSSRQKAQYGARSPRASPVSRLTISVE
jgi:hypothetical protein